MIPLLYANNADIKYPLSDFHETDIPNDILLDLSISVPAGVDPILAALRIGPSTVFLSIEERVTRAPVASVLVTSPVAARVYPLDMTMAGFGWVVFGSRVTTGEPYFSGDVVVDLDPEVFVSLQKTAPRLDLIVNGFPQDITNVLTLLAGSNLVTVTAENSTIYIDRNDDVMTEEDILALSTETSEDAFAASRILFTVAGTEPDDAGNIDIQVSGCAQDCGDIRALLLPHGDLTLAEDGELPLDIFSTRIFETGDPCAPPFTGTCGMVLIFQDEAQESYSPLGTVVWDADVADWDAKVELLGAPQYAQLCQVWQGPPHYTGEPFEPTEETSVCKPLDRGMPDGWTWDALVRSPTEAQCKAVYDSAKGGADVDDPTELVVLCVDNSGSMYTSTLGQGYSDFKDYLTSIGVEWHQVEYTDELWVRLATDWSINCKDIDVFDGCTDIIAIDIVDTAQNRAIGTLYTVER